MPGPTREPTRRISRLVVRVDGSNVELLWRRLTILVFTGAAVLQIAACGGTGKQPLSDINIEHEVTPQPVRVGLATIVLRLTGPSGKAVTGAQITLEGNMSHPGMAPVFAKATELEPGRYQAPLELSMAGDWVVLVHLTLADGQQVERHFELRGVVSK